MLRPASVSAFASTSMKFAKQLQRELRPEWNDHYIDYKMMKKIIKLYRQLDTLKAQADVDTAMIEELQQEVEALKALHRADIFVLRDKFLDAIQDLVIVSESAAGKPESLSRQEE